MITGRDRVRAALTFSTPDRPPRDLWALPYVQLFLKDGTSGGQVCTRVYGVVYSIPACSEKSLRCRGFTPLNGMLVNHVVLSPTVRYFAMSKENEMSGFGLQVSLYADVYARRVSCLGAYSPQQFFRSPHDLMPHEL